MARIRSIKPEFWRDEDIATELTRDERLLYIAMWNLCYDNWTMEYKPRSIKINTFPFDDDITVERIEQMLSRIAETGRLVFFEHDGKRCIWLPKCAEHQKVNRPVASPIPSPHDGCSDTTDEPLTEHSVNTHGTLTDESLQGKDRIRIGEEGDARAREGTPECMERARDDGVLVSFPGSQDMLPPWTHVLHAIERKKRSPVSLADVRIIAGAVNDACRSCAEHNAARCAGEVIARIQRARNLQTAAKFIREDLGGS